MTIYVVFWVNHSDYSDQHIKLFSSFDKAQTWVDKGEIEAVWGLLIPQGVETYELDDEGDLR